MFSFMYELSTNNILSSFIGEKGKTIFYYPFANPEKKEDVQQIIHYVTEMSKAQSDRLFAIISTTIIENYLDKILHFLLKDYEEKFLNQGFFSITKKLDLICALHLIPVHILDSAKVIIEIRNIFTQNLLFDSFDDLDKVSINRILDQRDQRKKIKYITSWDKKSTRGSFEKIVLVGMLGLKSYLTTVNLFAIAIQTEGFHKYLEVLNKKAVDRAHKKSDRCLKDYR